MGTKTSKQDDEYFHSEQKHSYENVQRAYAKWHHHSDLTTHDTSRFVSQEIENFKKHQEICLEQEKLKRTKSRSDQKTSSAKHQSTEQNLSSNHLITAEQLIKQQRPRSTISQSTNDLRPNGNTRQFSSTTNLNQNSSSKKQIPNDFQFVLINQADLQNAEEIGQGHFGTVYRALYKGTRDVALKTFHPQRQTNLKSSSDDYDQHICELLHEAHIMTQLQHVNLLRILGVTFFGNEKQLSLVTDLMKNGSLLDYLRKHQSIFLQSNSKEITMKLNHFSTQIFQAMLYLEERSIIHRDLAARNCLIGDNDILQVADFGLTKLTECGLYKGTYRTICALRWSSPEAIFSSKYTSRSDVWSYGITLWEIYSLGQRPYGILDNRTIRNYLRIPSENLTRFLPQSTQFGSDEVYTHLILSCLTYNVALRPRFKDLIGKITTIFNQNN